MSKQNRPLLRSNVIERATNYCSEHHERLTEPRLEVLKILSHSSQPLGAYEILDRLGKVLVSPKPPTVYRAIDFWLEHGFIHRIESLNAYILCHAECRHLGAQFIICDECGFVAESNIFEIPKALKQLTTSHAFTASSCHIELHGLCGSCCPNPKELNACC